MRSWITYSPTTVQQIVTIYENIFQRQPSPSEIGAREASLQSGATLANLTQSLAQYAQPNVDQIYWNILERAPLASEMSGAIADLSNGYTLSQAEGWLASSNEAQNDVNNIFVSILNRSSDWTTLTDYQNSLADGNSLTVERSWVAYSSDAQNEITGSFENEVGTAPSLGQVGQYQAYFNSGATLTNLWGTLSQQSAPVIDTLYGAVLDRAPTSTEVSSSEGYFAGGATQADIRNSLARLPETTTDLDNLIQRIQGRIADSNDIGWISAQESSLGSGEQTFAQIQTSLATWSGETGVVSPAIVTVFGYTPTQSEIGADESQLASGTSIGTILQGGYSSDFEQLDIQNIVQSFVTILPTEAQVSQATSLLSSGLSDVTFTLGSLPSTLANDALGFLQYFDPIDTSAAATTPSKQAANVATAQMYDGYSNVRAMLTVVGTAESNNKFYSLYSIDGTPRSFSDDSSFPGNGNVGGSGSGAYQIEATTFQAEKLRLGLGDFTKSTQILMGTDLMVKRGVMPLLTKAVMTQADFDTVLSKLSREWQALPQGEPINGVAGTGLDHSYYKYFDKATGTSGYPHIPSYANDLALFKSSGGSIQ